MESDLFSSFGADDDDDDFRQDYSGWQDQGVEEDDWEEERPVVSVAKRRRKQHVKEPAAKRVQHNFTKRDFFELILSWSLEHLLLPDEKSRASCSIDLRERPDRFKDFQEYTNFWYLFALEEARSILRNRLCSKISRLQAAGQTQTWQQREIKAILKSVRRESKKSCLITLEFVCLSNTSFETKYLAQTFALHPIRHGGNAISDEEQSSIPSCLCCVTLPSCSPTGNLFVSVHEMFWSAITREQNDSTSTHFSLQPLENLMTVYRSAQSCCEVSRPPFCNAMLGFSPPQHIRFDEDGLEQQVASKVVVCATATTSLYQDLNISQHQALTSCLDALLNSFSLNMVQGPPGTGKTFFTGRLLDALSQRPLTRIMATGPSNVSVVRMLEKVLENEGHCSKSRIVLFGVEEKLEDCASLPLTLPCTNHPPTLSDLYTTITNPRSVLDVLARLQVSNFISALAFFQTCSAVKVLLSSSLAKLAHEFSFCAKLLEHFLGAKDKIPYQRQLDAVSAVFSTEAPEANVLHDAVTVLVQRISSQKSVDDLVSGLLQQSTVIFATLSSVGNSVLRRAVSQVDIVVCDEAAQASEAQTLIPLTLYPSHLILIGDPAQLPAFVESTHAVVCGAGESLMGRLMRCGQQLHVLSTQYRMHPDIVQIINGEFYDNRLATAESVLTRSPLHSGRVGKDAGGDKRRNQPKWLTMPLSICCLEQSEEHGGGGVSWSNRKEAQFVVSLIEKIAHFHGKFFDVSQRVLVISFYAAQVHLIQKLLQQEGSGFAKIKVSTVDGVQGGEADIVIVSFVRKNDNGRIGFVSDRQRLNVALSRAKHQLLLVGSASTLRSSRFRGEQDTLARIILELEKKSVMA